MEDGRTRAYIKQQATMQMKQEGSLPPKGMGLANLSIKMKPSDKRKHLPKKPKVAVGSAGVTPDARKLPPMPIPEKGKGLMTGPSLVTKKLLVLLCEDSQYALKQLSSITNSDDYKDLDNHATEAIGEMISSVWLRYVSVFLSFLSCCFFILSNPCFLFLQGVLIMKGLMDCCLSQETVVDHVKVKVEATMVELGELKT